MRIKNFKKRISGLILLLSAMVLGQYKTADFELIGKVESVQSKTELIGKLGQTDVSGFLDSEQFDSIYLKFDAKRNLVLKENFLDYQGKLGIFDRTVFTYNPQNKIEKLETTLIQNGEEPRKIAQRKVFYYLGNLLIRTDEFNSGRTSDQYWVVNSVYDNGKLKEKVFWMEDEIFSKTYFEFDWNYNPIGEKTIHNNGVVGQTILYENNKEGLPILMLTSSGNLKTTELFEYGTNYKSAHKIYDQQNKLLKSEVFEKSGMISVIEKWNHKSQSLDRFDFKFEMDENNNWISCVISTNHLPTYIIKRKIKYYK